MLASRGRVELRYDVSDWVERCLSLPGVQLLPLSAQAAILAGRGDFGLAGDPVDQLIAATAIEQDALLVTRDEQLRDFPKVRTIW